MCNQTWSGIAMNLSRLWRPAVIVLVAGACASSGALAIDTLKKIRDTGAITLGYRESSVPFSFLDATKQPVGYSMDLCYKVVAALKRELKMSNLAVKLQPVTP